MELEGGCQCGAVRYRVEGEPEHVALCHCSDCRKASGAPMVAWAAFKSPHFAVTAGAAKSYNSSGASMRHFCGTCGTSMYFLNETYLPGLVDIQVATLDTPEALPPGVQIQVAERLGWMRDIGSLPEFERYPG